MRPEILGEMKAVVPNGTWRSHIYIYISVYSGLLLGVDPNAKQIRVFVQVRWAPPISLALVEKANTWGIDARTDVLRFWIRDTHEHQLMF